MSMNIKPWYQDPASFFSLKNMLSFFPSSNMGPTQKYNTLSRLVLYTALIALYRKYNPKNVAYISGGTIALLTVLESKQREFIETELAMMSEDDFENNNNTTNNTNNNNDVMKEKMSGKPSSYLTKAPNEPFPGANRAATHLTTSTSEVSGRSVIAANSSEKKRAYRPVSTAKGIDSKYYDYMSGAVGSNKRVMNVV